MGPDPISVAELRDATWLLDTNVLLTIALERVAYGAPVDALGQAMAMIRSELVYLHCTLLEYQSVVDRWSSETLIALNRFGIGPIRESSDPFRKLAVARQCFTVQDFRRFFRELRQPPSSIEDRVGVELVDDPAVARAARAGEKDEAKVEKIRSHWSERRPSSKSLTRAQHDAAVSEVARRWRSSGKKCFVLTMDRTMAELAARWQGPSGTPSWILLDALVQVLAADRAGIAEDEVDFSALLAKLIANEVGPVADEFQMRDLLWLSEIVEQVEAFPDEVVGELARVVHRKRVAGARQNDPDLRLVLERTIQKAREALIKGHDHALQGAARATEHAEDAWKGRKRLRRELVKSTKKTLIRRARRALFLRVALALLGAAAIGVIAGGLVLWAAPDINSRVDALSVIVGIVALVAPLAMATVKWIWPRYREDRRNVSEKAEHQVSGVERGGSEPDEPAA